MCIATLWTDFDEGMLALPIRKYKMWRICLEFSFKSAYERFTVYLRDVNQPFGLEGGKPSSGKDVGDAPF